MVCLRFWKLRDTVFMRFRLPSIITTLILAGCATSYGPAVSSCENDSYRIDSEFEAGQFYSCSINTEGLAVLTIRPEDEPPINPSPWYAFRVTPKEAGGVMVRLDVIHGRARYWPKISIDEVNWQPMKESLVSRSDDLKSMTMRLQLEDDVVWVAGQELIRTAFYEEWFEDLSAHDEIETQLLGYSVQDRAIYFAKTAEKPEVVFLLGRQHPPEITGAIAMRPFVDTVLGDSPLAKRFRDRYMIVVIPILNPDGVYLGHWRHNVNGVDLNRDWGPFSQPETQGAERLLAELDEAGLQIRLMLDFHSTMSNKFYTQLKDDGAVPELFASKWLSRASVRLPDFEFEHDARERSEQPNTKNYFFKRYGIPSITYELGDETDRDQIVASAPVFAEEMMRLMLEYEPD